MRGSVHRVSKKRGTARRDRGALENEVLAALASGPMTPREVRRHLGEELAYTTVMTTLARLHEKGAATRESAGRTFTYQLADGASVQARTMRRALDAGLDREQVLARFLDELGPDDVPVLRRLLRQAKGR
jgi:predicted transcriptional regulator